MESKYNLLTRLLKNIKNVVNPDGSVAGSGEVFVVRSTHDEATGLDTLDASFNDINNAFSDEKIVMLISDFTNKGTDLSYMIKIVDGGDTVAQGRRYAVLFNKFVFFADSPDDPMDSDDGTDGGLIGDTTAE